MADVAVWQRAAGTRTNIGLIDLVSFHREEPPENAYTSLEPAPSFLRVVRRLIADLVANLGSYRGRDGCDRTAPQRSRTW